MDASISADAIFSGPLASPQTTPLAPPPTKPQQEPKPAPTTPAQPQPKRELDPFNPDWPTTRPTPEPKA